MTREFLITMNLQSVQSSSGANPDMRRTNGEERIRKQAAKHLLFHKFTCFITLLNNNSDMKSISNKLQLKLKSKSVYHPLRL